MGAAPTEQRDSVWALLAFLVGPEAPMLGPKGGHRTACAQRASRTIDHTHDDTDDPVPRVAESVHTETDADSSDTEEKGKH